MHFKLFLWCKIRISLHIHPSLHFWTQLQQAEGPVSRAEGNAIFSPPDLLEDPKSVQHHIKTCVTSFFSCLPGFVSSCTSPALLYHVQ